MGLWKQAWPLQQASLGLGLSAEALPAQVPAPVLLVWVIPWRLPRWAFVLKQRRALVTISLVLYSALSDQSKPLQLLWWVYRLVFQLFPRLGYYLTARPVPQEREMGIPIRPS